MHVCHVYGNVAKQELRDPGPVVQKLFNTNPRLKIKKEFYFSTALIFYIILH